MALKAKMSDQYKITRAQREGRKTIQYSHVLVRAVKPSMTLSDYQLLSQPSLARDLPYNSCQIVSI